MRSGNPIAGTTFTTETLRVITKAFDAAWAEIEPHFYDTPIAAEIAHLKLTDAILAAATENSSDSEQIKNLGLQRMALEYRFDRANAGTRAIVGQRMHNAQYWRNYVEETLAKADEMTDPECKRLLIGVADTYAQLARHAAALEARRNKKGDEPQR